MYARACFFFYVYASGVRTLARLYVYLCVCSCIRARARVRMRLFCARFYLMVSIQVPILTILLCYGIFDVFDETNLKELNPDITLSGFETPADKQT